MKKHLPSVTFAALLVGLFAWMSQAPTMNLAQAGVFGGSGGSASGGAGTFTSGTFTGNLAVNGNTTLGDASADTCTVVATATFNEPVSLKEGTAPSATANYGKLYVKSSDSNLYFKDDSGTETKLNNTALSSTTGAILKKSAVQGVSTGGDGAAVTFDQEERDDGSYHDNVTNNTRITVSTTGWYSFQANICFQSAATGEREAFLVINGGYPASASAMRYNNFASATTEAGVVASGPLYLTAGDYVEVWAYQNSGGALNVYASTTGCSTFSVVKLP